MDINIFPEYSELITQKLQNKKGAIIHSLLKEGIITHTEFGQLHQRINVDKDDNMLFRDIFNIVLQKRKMEQFAVVLRTLRTHEAREILSIIENPPEAFFKTKLEDTSFIVGTNFSMMCQLDKLYPVIWYKDGVQLQSNNNVKIEAVGTTHKMTIIEPSKKFSGEFSCRCGKAETKCKVKVDEAKFVDPLPSDYAVEVGQTATLKCKLNKDVTVTWFKANEVIQQSSNVEITNTNGIHQLKLTNAKITDSAPYSCRCDDNITVCSLRVEETEEIKREKMENEFRQYPKDRLIRRLVEAQLEIEDKTKKIDELQNQVETIIEENSTNTERQQNANKEILHLKVKIKEYEYEIKLLKETVCFWQSKLDQTNEIQRQHNESLAAEMKQIREMIMQQSKEQSKSTASAAQQAIEANANHPMTSAADVKSLTNVIKEVLEEQRRSQKKMNEFMQELQQRSQTKKTLLTEHSKEKQKEIDNIKLGTNQESTSSNVIKSLKQQEKTTLDQRKTQEKLDKLSQQLEQMLKTEKTPLKEESTSSNVTKSLKQQEKATLDQRKTQEKLDKLSQQLEQMLKTEKTLLKATDVETLQHFHDVLQEKERLEKELVEMNQKLQDRNKLKEQLREANQELRRMESRICVIL